MKGILERQWSRKGSCDEVETVREFTYLGDRVSAGSGCEPEQDVDGLRLGSAMSCCMVGDFL